MHMTNTSIAATLLLALLAPGASAANGPRGQQQPSDAQSSQPATTRPAPLEALLDRARATQSDAVVIVRDGRTIVEEYFDNPIGPIEAMSATKSVVALAFGRLLADGRLESLDVPVHTYYPEWNQGRKAKITIRHLLTQQAGLQCEPITTEIYRSPDFVQLALAAELLEDPGTQWRYNNKATNLVAGVVAKIAGKRMDVLIGEEIFKPLGITDWTWSLDDAGNPHAMSGLQIRPADLVKIGQLMLNGGEWEGQQVLPKDFVAEAVRDQITPPPDDPQSIPMKDMMSEGGFRRFGYGPHYGLLWWVSWEAEPTVTDRLLEEWKRTGAPEEFLKKMATLKGVTGDELWTRFREIITEPEWFAATVEANRPDWDNLGWHYRGYSAKGYLGQYLIVLPEQRLIAVRMRRSPEVEFDESKIDSFTDFSQRVERLAAKAPVSVDLRPKMEEFNLPPRAQGARGTCSIFTTCEAIEFALAVHRSGGGGKAQRLSPEYLNWAAAGANGHPSDGNFFHNALAGFEKHGICAEERMPYQSAFDAKIAPSAEALEEAKRIGEEARAALKVRWIVPWNVGRFGVDEDDFAEIKQVLALGYPVAAGSGHSRLLVGYRDDAEAGGAAGGGVFITLDSALNRFDEVTYEFVRNEVADVFWVEAVSPAQTP